MAKSSFNTVVKLDDTGAKKLLKALNSTKKVPISSTPIKVESNEEELRKIILRCQKNKGDE